MSETRPSPAAAPLGDAPAGATGIKSAARFSALAYGVRFGVEVDAADLVDRVPHHLPPTAEIQPAGSGGRLYSLQPHRSDPAADPRYTVFADRKPLICGVGAAAALRAFEADVQIHVAEMSPHFVFVHAGVVGWQGRAILLPGRSFCGKTTLVEALVRLGADYCSDEYAVLDPSGDVRPYPRALSIRLENGIGVVRRFVRELGGHEVEGSLSVGLVVMSRYRSAGVWQPRQISPGQAALALLENTVPARRRPEVALATLRQVVSKARVFSSERGEASGVAAQIVQLAEQG